VVLDAAEVVVDDDRGVGVAAPDRLGYLLRGGSRPAHCTSFFLTGAVSLNGAAGAGAV
jgi:hypothetical protein